MGCVGAYPDSYSNLTMLTTISFSNNRNCNREKYLQRLIPQSWGKLLNLKYIYFNNEGISGDLSVLSNMNKLVELRFSDSPLLSGPLSFIKSSRIVRGTAYPIS